MNLVTEQTSQLSLSLDLPLSDSQSNTWIGRAVARLNSVRERFNTPITWVWNGEPPMTKSDFDPLRGNARNDLGWRIPASQETRLAYRNRLIGLLKRWSATFKGTGLQLRMAVINESKTMIPYDGLVESGIVAIRHTECMTTTKSGPAMQPQIGQTGLWQLPIHAELHLNGGWLTMAREMRQINALPKLIASNPGAHFHLRVILDTTAEPGSRVMGQWERILQYVDSLRNNGVAVDSAAELLQIKLVQTRRATGSILRAA
jgi:hypothetical protein